MTSDKPMTHIGRSWPTGAWTLYGDQFKDLDFWGETSLDAPEMLPKGSVSSVDTRYLRSISHLCLRPGCTG